MGVPKAAEPKTEERAKLFDAASLAIFLADTDDFPYGPASV